MQPDAHQFIQIMSLDVSNMFGRTTLKETPYALFQLKSVHNTSLLQSET